MLFAFDFVVGYKKRAPRWLSALSLEWLYRFYQEPRRLWYRYTVLNSLFLISLLIDETKKMSRAAFQNFFKNKDQG